MAVRCNFNIQTDKVIKAQKPDLVLLDNKDIEKVSKYRNIYKPRAARV